MVNNVSHHDAKIIGLHFSQQEALLTMELVTENNQEFLVKLTGVVSLELNSFEEQNIIFDINEFTEKTITDELIKEANLSEKNTSLIQTGQKSLFFIDASIGLVGYIVADSLEII